MDGFVFDGLAFAERLVPLALARHDEEGDSRQNEQDERAPGEAERESELEAAAEPVVALDAVVHVVQHAAEHLDAHHHRRRCRIK